MRHVINLDYVRLFLRAVDHGGFKAGAASINMPKSTFAQRIAALEEQVGTSLFRRTSRSLSLTDAGANLVSHARGLEEVARQIERQFGDVDGELHGRLRISSSKAIAQFALSKLIPRFLELHPRASITLETTNKLVDLVADGFDMTIRAHVGPLKDSSLTQRAVARTPWMMVASPSWLRRRSAPILAPEDIPPDEVLCFSSTPNATIWTLKNHHESVALEIRPRIVLDDMIAVRQACIVGSGIACLPGYLLCSAIEAGDLVRILPEWDCQTSTISVLTAPKPHSSRLASTFSNYLAAEMPDVLRL